MASRLVCVTGASGFVASHVVSELLASGYTVRATVRDLTNTKKLNHLKALPGAKDRLQLFEADLMRDGSFDRAVDGVDGVFHVASPFFTRNVTDPEKQLINPALQGTLSVLGSVRKAKSVTRVVLTSSMVAMVVNKDAMSPGHVVTESDWSDEEFMRANKQWYPLSKTLAERAAWSFMNEHESSSFDLVTVNPTLVIGPLLQPSLNTSSQIVLEYLTGKRNKISKSTIGMVDVRDCAQAHRLAYENRGFTGRLLLEHEEVSWGRLCKTLNRVEGSRAPHPSADDLDVQPSLLFSNAKAKELGVNFRPTEESIACTVRSLIEHHHWNDANAAKL
eukprot:TRINITY_DN8677_c0_g1_i1.p1 TRINITY_DN8677_c0_g1~~TRINITY_DN8677_c0_g1_i1.p1  ORF type:complete len:333 (+),score=52.33 TRINITY_DN8677_c0_g1_i1:105-1103(+)